MIGNVLKYLAGYLACKLLTPAEGQKSFETKDFEVIYLTAKLDDSGRKIFYTKDLIHAFKESDSIEFISQYLKQKLDIANKYILISYPGVNEELITFFESLLKTLNKRYWKREAGARETIWLKQMQVIS